MHLLKHLWPFSRKDDALVSKANEEAFCSCPPVSPVAAIVVKNSSWKQSPELLLKPGHAHAQNALLLSLAMKGRPFTTLGAAEHLRRRGNRSVAAGKRISDLRTALLSMGVILKDTWVTLPSEKRCKQYHLTAQDIHRIRLKKLELSYNQGK